jgi:hypothetical protein
MTENQRKKAKKRWYKKEANKDDCFDLDLCPTEEEEKEYVMNTDHKNNERYYLQTRADNIHFYKVRELQRKYGLVDDQAPKSPSEAIQRLKDGKYTLPTDEEYQKHYAYANPIGLLRWRDPDLKEDKDGFNKATEALGVTMKPLFDAINILDPKDALVVLQEFEKNNT